MTKTPEQTFGIIVSDIARLIHRDFDKRAQTLGLTRSQWSVLAYLHEQDGLRQTDLAHRLDIRPISLSRLIDRMAKNNLVQRLDDKNDRRVKRIHLTKKAKSLTPKLQTMADQTHEQALHHLSKEDRKQLFKLLINVREKLTDSTQD